MSFDLTAKGFSLANAKVCAALAQQVYGPQFNIDGEPSGGVTAIINGPTDTHVGIFVQDNCIIIAARGSASIRNWITDFDAMRENITGLGWAHRGFENAADAVLGPILSVLKALDPHLPIVVTGHSLGGSLALLLGYRLAIALPGRVNSIYALEPAKVGGEAFRQVFDATCGSRTFCVTNGADIVPWLPLGFGYRRVGQEIFFPSGGGSGSNDLGSWIGGYAINPTALQKLWSDKWEFTKEFFRLKAQRWIPWAPFNSPLLADHPIGAVIARMNA